VIPSSNILPLMPFISSRDPGWRIQIWRGNLAQWHFD
jgi:hypothetical protein